MQIFAIRAITLDWTNGEVYAPVRPDRRRPIIVVSSLAHVTVVGWLFNNNAHSDFLLSFLFPGPDIVQDLPQAVMPEEEERSKRKYSYQSLEVDRRESQVTRRSASNDKMHF